MDDAVVIKDSGTFRSSYQLADNTVDGFETAVRNGQTRLALEYAVRVIADLRKDVDALKNSTAQAEVKARKSASTSKKEDTAD